MTMSPEQVVVIRDVGPDEAEWLDRVYTKGETLWIFNGPTYGCITSHGIAVSEKPGQNPFFELPRDAVAMADSRS